MAADAGGIWSRISRAFWKRTFAAAGRDPEERDRQIVKTAALAAPRVEAGSPDAAFLRDNLRRSLIDKRRMGGLDALLIGDKR